LPHHWLVKSEPEVYSIDDLRRDARTCWEGVRNYTARIYLREMAVGDPVLFYHSNADPPAVVGIAAVARTAYDDPTALDPRSPYYDEGAPPDRWSMVDVEFVAKLPNPVSLDRLKKYAEAELDGMEVVRQASRLSVQKVLPAHFEFVKALAEVPDPAIQRKKAKEAAKKAAKQAAKQAPAKPAAAKTAAPKKPAPKKPAPKKPAAKGAPVKKPAVKKQAAKAKNKKKASGPRSR
jgi:predicted RNA-binding protein with PUA-like domain